MAESIKKNYLYSITYQILAIIIPIITAPYLTRTMGAECLGVYAYTFSISQYFFMFAMLGMNNYGNRLIASVRDNNIRKNRTFSELLMMQIIIGVAVSLLYICYLLYLYYVANSIYFIPALIWFLHIISGIVDISWFFWGIEKFKVTVVRNCILKVLTTFGIFLFVESPEDLWLYILLIAGSSFASQLYLWFCLSKEVTFVRVRVNDCLLHISPNIKLFIPVVAVSVYTILDKFMIGELSTMEQLGYFDNVQKIMTLPTGLITALGAVMLPRMSNLISKKDFGSVNVYLRQNMLFTNLFSLAFVAGLMSIGPNFAIVYFGSDFSTCGGMISLMSITVFIIAWANVIRTQYLIPIHRDRDYISSAVLGAVVNVVSNLMFIPSYHAYGAIVSSILAELSVALYLTYVVRNELPINVYIKEGAHFIIPAICMGTTVFIVGEMMKASILTLIMQIAIGLVLYIVTCSYIIKKRNMVLSALITSTVSKLLRKK